VEANVITEKQLQDALYRQKEAGGRLGRNLAELGYLNEDDLTPYIAEQHGMPFISLDRYDINSRVYNIIPDEIIHTYGMIPIDLIRDIITLAITDVPSEETIKGIEKLTGFKIQVVMITKGDFNRYTKNTYDLSVVDKDKELESADTEQFIKTPEYQGRERRRYPRFGQRLKVKYEFRDEVTVNPSVNISRGGVLIKSKSPVPVNAHIILRIELPNAREDVIVISRVVWVEKISDTDTYMIALSFSSMGSDDNKTLVRFIESIGNSRTF
jgi:Tfp pilus assembly protein PilZ